MLQLIQTFLNKNYDIVFASAAAHSEHAIDLKVLGVSTANIELNNSSFNEFIRETQPDVVLFDRFMTEEQFGWRVAEECPNALRILDTEDLHSLRKVRQDCFKKKNEFSVTDWLQADITKREIASIYRCDLSLIISEYEMQFLQNTIQIQSSLLQYLPFMLDPVSNDKKQALPKFEDREHFVTIGNFRHEPNYNSVLYLKETIWPLLKQELPDAELHVYGSYPTQKVTQLENKAARFFIKGWADDVNEVMKSARVCLAPLRFGAGLKGKFIDAMQNGTPSVTTTIGAEGLEDNFGGFIENNPDEIVIKTIELYTNSTVWKDKQTVGFDMLDKFNKNTLQQQLLDSIEDKLKHLEALRATNFTGAMLQHQTMQSTKYMSKWIEEKNKEI